MAASFAAPPVAAQANPEGQWEGAITLPNAQLKISVKVTKAEAGWSATIDIPQQGASGLALKNVRFEDPKVSFEVEFPKAYTVLRRN